MNVAEINMRSGQVVDAAMSELVPIHEAQLLSYLRLSDYRVGLLINFHVVHLKDGIKRMVHEL